MSRVALRPLESGDRARLLAWRNSPDVARYMYNDRPITETEHARWFEAATQDERRYYRLILLGETPVGLFNFYDISTAHRSAKWAFYLADPVVRGQGVGSVIEHFALSRAFDHMGLNRLACEVLASNTPVIAMHESFGFQREGLLRQAVAKDGGFEDVVVLAALAAHWPAMKERADSRLAEKGLQPAGQAG